MSKLTRSFHRFTLSAPTSTTVKSVVVAGVIGWMTTVAPVVAQGLFSPQILVNESSITGYELQQRAAMLRVFRAPGNPEDLAREQLIDERLRLQVADDAGVRPTEEEILDGMAEFASRANMDTDTFLRALAQEGISEESYRDFVNAGLAWRQYGAAALCAPRCGIGGRS